MKDTNWKVIYRSDRYVTLIEDTFEPVLRHIIKTGFKDKYMIVNEDAIDQDTGKVNFHTKAEVEKLYNFSSDQLSIYELLNRERPSTYTTVKIVKSDGPWTNDFIGKEFPVIEPTYNKAGLDLENYWQLPLIQADFIYGENASPLTFYIKKDNCEITSAQSAG